MRKSDMFLEGGGIFILFILLILFCTVLILLPYILKYFWGPGQIECCLLRKHHDQQHTK